MWSCSARTSVLTCELKYHTGALGLGLNILTCELQYHTGTRGTGSIYSTPCNTYGYLIQLKVYRLDSSQGAGHCSAISSFQIICSNTCKRGKLSMGTRSIWLPRTTHRQAPHNRMSRTVWQMTEAGALRGWLGGHGQSVSSQACVEARAGPVATVSAPRQNHVSIGPAERQHSVSVVPAPRQYRFSTM